MTACPSYAGRQILPCFATHYPGSSFSSRKIRHRHGLAEKSTPSPAHLPMSSLLILFNMMMRSAHVQTFLWDNKTQTDPKKEGSDVYPKVLTSPKLGLLDSSNTVLFWRQAFRHCTRQSQMNIFTATCQGATRFSSCV